MREALTTAPYLFLGLPLPNNRGIHLGLSLMLIFIVKNILKLTTHPNSL